MFSQTKNVNGDRIKEAREISGFSQTSFAELLYLQRATISAYEKNKIKPSSEVLFRISSLTGFPISFFLSERAHDVNFRKSPITFRKLSAATKTARIQGERIEEILFDIHSFLSEYIEFSKPNIPFFDIDFHLLENQDIEELASKTRRAWGMGDGPIVNLVQFLENNGIIIGTAILDQKLDAFSTWHDNIPIIILSDNKGTAVRRRFNLAHELGHLILHSTIDDEILDKDIRDKIEQQADYFAGAFLLPAKTLAQEYFSNSIQALTHIKKRWKVSIAAIALRLKDLGVINENQKSYVMVQLNQSPHGRRKEPLDDEIEFEFPCMLKDAFTLLINSKVLTTQSIIDHCAIPDILLFSLTGSNPELFINSNDNQKATLQLKL